VKPSYTIAVFDFDGTITTKDTLIDFTIYSLGRRKFIQGFFRLFPVLFSYRIGLFSGGFVKEKFLSYFFEGLEERQFNDFCNDYVLKRINEITKKEVLEKAKWHKQQGHKLIIISASIENWIKPWAQNNSFDEVIATKIEAKNGRLTGKLATNNCQGQEKVRRFLEKHPDREKYFLYVYSDSKTDKPLLSLADKQIFIRRRSLFS